MRKAPSQLRRKPRIRWASDSNLMPRFNAADGVGNPITFISGAVSADLDATGRPEIVIGASVFDADGRLLGDGRTLGGTTGTNVRSTLLVVADLDLDGVPEVGAGPTACRLTGGRLEKVWQRAGTGPSGGAPGRSG